MMKDVVKRYIMYMIFDTFCFLLIEKTGMLTSKGLPLDLVSVLVLGAVSLIASIAHRRFMVLVGPEEFSATRHLAVISIILIAAAAMDVALLRVLVENSILEANLTAIIILSVICQAGFAFEEPILKWHYHKDDET